MASANVRFKNSATAEFFASYFSGKRKYTHDDPGSIDPFEALSPIMEDGIIRPIEVAVISGTPEAIYWSKVPAHARTGL